MAMMFLHVFLGLLLLLIPGGVLYLLDRPLLRTLSVAVLRMAGQLLAVCLVVWVLFRFQRGWMNLLWLALMTVWASAMLSRRKKLDKRRFLPVVIGVLVSTLLVGGYLLLAVLPAEHGMEAQWFVPVMALLLGHTLTMTLRGMKTYDSALKADEQQYEFLRGNGASRFQAVLPFVRRAFQSVLAPTAANLSEMGLFTMPLLLCGIFLGGVQPVNAFVVTIMLILGCIASSVIALALSIWLAEKR